MYFNRRSLLGLVALLAALSAVLTVVLTGSHSGSVNAQSLYGWSPQTRKVQLNLNDVHFADASNGWVVGDAVGVTGDGGILRTTDGGATWSKVSGITTDLYGVDFIDASNGWAVGSGGAILRTTDGGATWSAQTSNTPATLRGGPLRRQEQWLGRGDLRQDRAHHRWRRQLERPDHRDGSTE